MSRSTWKIVESPPACDGKGSDGTVNTGAHPYLLDMERKRYAVFLWIYGRMR